MEFDWREIVVDPGLIYFCAVVLRDGLGKSADYLGAAPEEHKVKVIYLTI